ncbi:Hypothetical predicted protein, partial [Olea europaea subsp. europaea]
MAGISTSGDTQTMPIIQQISSTAKLDSSNPNFDADDANHNGRGAPPPLPPPHHAEAFAHMGHSNLDSIWTNRLGQFILRERFIYIFQ